jgi:hypothetical protein
MRQLTASCPKSCVIFATLRDKIAIEILKIVFDETSLVSNLNFHIFLSLQNLYIKD